MPRVKRTENQLSDPWWRLNNLYYIKDKTGKKIKFKPNWAQYALYTDMWFLNCVLKARQLGMTTFIQLFMLDRCLFNDNQSAGIVAHNKEDAEAFFSDKIKFAYDNLPEDLRAMRKATNDTARSLKFSNGSNIRVGTSMRSGTYQYIHISEFGKMCAKFPDKAAEVITGTLNTIAVGQMVFIESTAEGPFGEFYDMCKTSEMLTMAVNNGQTDFTQLDYKFFFFPWWKHPDYVLHEKVEMPDKLMTYFKDLREEHDIDLKPEQKAWYVKKYAEQRDKMKQEYPSVASEAFERSTELAIYGKQLRRAREQSRICKLPIARGVPVNTFWDLGRNDVCSIWFHQHVEQRHHFIYYFESRLEDLAFYADQLRELKAEYKWFYGDHFLPHDVEVTDISAIQNKSRRMMLQESGVSPITTVPKIRNICDGIEMTRRKFDECWFDEEGCEIGLRALYGYEWLYDEMHKTTRKTPAHNWACVTGETEVLTPRGKRQIMNLPSSGEVLTRCGWKKYENPRVTRHAPLVAVTFDDGFTVKCTPDHRFLTANGWRFAKDLTPGLLIQSGSTRSPSISTENCIGYIQNNRITHAAGGCCIGMYGVAPLGISRQTIISIIKTEIAMITGWLISNAYPGQCTRKFTVPSALNPLMGGLRQRPGNLPLIGTHPKRGGYGIPDTQNEAGRGRNGGGRKNPVRFAVRLWRHWLEKALRHRNIAPTNVNPKRILSVKKLNETADVWCLTVPDAGEFALANGAIVHNSNAADAFRQFGQGYRGKLVGFKGQAAKAGDMDGTGGRAYARARNRRGTLTNPSLTHIL